MHNDECICNVQKDFEPEESKRSLKAIIGDWLYTPVTREEVLRTLLILGEVIFDITIIIKSRKRK